MVGPLIAVVTFAAALGSGLMAGLFSLTLGTIYVLSLDAIVPAMDSLLPF